MKVLLIKKGERYVDCAILLEPIGNIGDYQKHQIIQSASGIINDDSTIDKKLTVEVYKAEPSVRYSVLITDYIRKAIGKSFDGR